MQLTYNADGFNTEVHYPDGRVLYKGYATGGTYNNHGRVTSVRDGPTGFELQYAYDDLDRVTGVSFPDGSQFSVRVRVLWGRAGDRPVGPDHVLQPRYAGPPQPDPRSPGPFGEPDL